MWYYQFWAIGASSAVRSATYKSCPKSNRCFWIAQQWAEVCHLSVKTLLWSKRYALNVVASGLYRIYFFHCDLLLKYALQLKILPLVKYVQWLGFFWTNPTNQMKLIANCVIFMGSSLFIFTLKITAPRFMTIAVVVGLV